MSDATTLRVALDARSYDIVVGTALLGAAGARLKTAVKARRAIVVTDENVARHHLATLERSLSQAAIESRAIILPPGEGTKDFAHLQSLVESLLDARIERGSIVVAFGGGVIGDLAGFAAAVALRGVDFVQIPTTLLAQVDSSVGGKTGINTRHGKNLVGAFHQPKLVLADVDVLATLPKRERLAGYAEIVKYGLIDDPDFFAWLERDGRKVIDGDSAATIAAVVTSCKAKAAIVAADEREAGARALLNLGHTFGHALEAEAGFGDTLLHGEAVAIGMVMAFDLSVRLGLCPPEDAARMRRHLAAIGLPVDLKRLAGPAWTAEALLAHMAQDKKVVDGRTTFILTRGIGKAFISRDVPAADVLDLLRGAIAA